MGVDVAGFVVDVGHAFDAFPVGICLGPPAGVDVLVVFGPGWEIVEEEESLVFGFLEYGNVVRSVGVGMLIDAILRHQ